MNKSKRWPKIGDFLKIKSRKYSKMETHLKPQIKNFPSESKLQTSESQSLPLEKTIDLEEPIQLLESYQLLIVKT